MQTASSFRCAILALLAIAGAGLTPAAAAQEHALAPAATATAAPADLALLLRPIRERSGVPALGAAVVRGGQTVALGADGVRRRGRPEPVERGDRWHLGSCTKSMTAVWIATFVEEGRTEWSATLGSSLGREVEGFDARWSAVTLAELLAHRGGAPAEIDRGGLWLELRTSRASAAEQRLELARGVLSRPPVAERGARFVYSNTGFALAAAAVERELAVGFEASIRERLFAPLGMASAGFGAPGTSGALSEPRGHMADDTPVEPGPLADNPDAIAPAGKVHASLGDWAKYAACVLAGARGGSLLLKPETWAELTGSKAGRDDDHAFGWIRTERPWAGGRVLTHAGSNTCWYAVAWLAPERDIALLVTANQGGERAREACDEVAAKLVECHVAAEAAGSSGR